MADNWSELFGIEEWDYICRLGASKHDPEEKKAFWETVKAKKRENAAWSIYDDFPKEVGGTKKFPGHEICAEILNTLKGHKRKDQSNVG